jgi:ornithine cyclodeaminase
MHSIGPSEVIAALDFTGLIEGLRQMFRTGCEVRPPQRFAVGQGGEASLELVPAWQDGRHIGVRLLTEFPGNPTLGLPAAMGSYLLLDGRTGRPLALLDAPALRLRRTAAASALAASYLARPDCERLLMVGTGALAPHLVEAHASVRPIRNVLVWGRDSAKARRLARRLDRRSLKVAATDDLAGAVRGAHVICCATMASEPLIRGSWLPLGVHLDLVGGIGPGMREADDEVVQRARIFVDIRTEAVFETGDIAEPLRSGLLRLDDIAGDLFELARGARAGRRFHDQITMFKSVGSPLEDLAAAQLALERIAT